MMMSDSSKTTSEALDKLDWIQLRKEVYGDDIVETFTEKLLRKTKENPFVPIGTIATISALTYGLWNFYNGNQQMSQYMMRVRVGAQALTIVSIATGFYLYKKQEE